MSFSYHYTPFTRYNRLSNGFDNRVERTATVRSTGCTTGMTTGCIHDTAGCQQVVSCKRGFTMQWNSEVYLHGVHPSMDPVRLYYAL